MKEGLPSLCEVLGAVLIAGMSGAWGIAEGEVLRNTGTVVLNIVS